MIRSVCCSGQWPSLAALRDLLLERILQNRRSELVLAEKGELTAVLEAEEIGQAVFAYAFGAGRAQQHAVDMGETRGRRPGAWHRPGRPTCRRASGSRPGWPFWPGRLTGGRENSRAREGILARI